MSTTAAPEARRAALRLSEHVTRQASFALRAVGDDEPNDGLTLDGYGAVFNTDTIELEKNLDAVESIVAMIQERMASR